MLTIELQSHASQEQVQISISRDGELYYDKQLVEEALQYDHSMIEFGESINSLVDFFDNWNKEPIDILHFYFIFSGSQDALNDAYAGPNTQSAISGMLILDYAKHVLSGRYKKWILDQFNKIENCLAAEIDFSNDKTNKIKGIIWDDLYNKSEKSEHKIDERLNLISEKEGSLAFNTAILSAASWAAAAYQSAIPNWAQIASDHAAAAMGAKVANLHRLSDEYKEAVAAEKAWQIRRFVHVMEALRDEQPRPRISETK